MQDYKIKEALNIILQLSCLLNMFKMIHDLQN